MRELWQAVIFQMVSDSTINIIPRKKGSSHTTTNRKLRLRVRDEAIRWLNNDDGRNGLRSVCDLAGISYDVFYGKYLRLHKDRMDDDKIKSDMSNRKSRYRNINI